MEDLCSIKFSNALLHNVDVPASLSSTFQKLAVANECQLNIWDIDSKKISHRFSCESAIDFIKWSPDSEMICCRNLKSVIQIFNLDNPCWKCKINEDSLPSNIHWALDSLHILLISEFNIKLTIFSLASTLVAEIDNLKTIENVISFSSCKKYLAVAHRLNFEDYLGIYSCDSWEKLKFFQIETKNLAAFQFSPMDLVLSVLESLECKIYFYSIDGRLLGKYFTTANFAPSMFTWNLYGSILALGDFSGEVKIMNTKTYKMISCYEHPHLIESEDTAVYKLSENLENISPTNKVLDWEICEVVKKRPFSFPNCTTSEKPKRKSLKHGINILKFSACGRYIASVNGAMPKVICIYDLIKSELSEILVQAHNIECLSWHPKKSFLIFCTSSSTLHMWTPNFCVQFMVPFQNYFSIASVEWCAIKDCIILNSKEESTILYLP